MRNTAQAGSEGGVTPKGLQWYNENVNPARFNRKAEPPPPPPPAPAEAPAGAGPSESSAPKPPRDQGSLIKKTAVGESTQRKRRTAIETLLGLSGNRKPTILGE